MDGGATFRLPLPPESSVGLRDAGGRATADGSDPRSPIVRIHAVPDDKVRADLSAKLVRLCNASLAKGADDKASVTAVGDCLAVQSVSPEFHILAGQLIRGVAGVTVSVPEDASLRHCPREGCVGGSF